MAYIGTAGDTSQVDEDDMNKSRGIRELDPGWYRAALIEDESKDFQWGVGLNMQLEILDGEYKNQRIFDFLCLIHSESEDAQRIARTRLRELATAAGHKRPDMVDDTGALYGRPVMVEVYRAKEKDPKYAESDGRRPRVSQYKSVAAWKEENAGEPTPGIVRKKASPPPQEPPPPDPDDDGEIPF